jgi:hypothetical protein
MEGGEGEWARSAVPVPLSVDVADVVVVAPLNQHPSSIPRNRAVPPGMNLVGTTVALMTLSIPPIPYHRIIPETSVAFCRTKLQRMKSSEGFGFG